MWHPHYWHSYRETFPEAPGPQVNGRPDMALAADTANAQGQAAASTTAGGRGDIPRRMGYHSYAWNEHYYRRRGRGGRRLIWFGLGVAATAWYFKHKQHLIAEERARNTNVHHEDDSAARHSKHPSYNSPRSEDMARYNIAPPKSRLNVEESAVLSAIAAQKEGVTGAEYNKPTRTWGWFGRSGRHTHAEIGTTAEGGIPSPSERDVQTKQPALRAYTTSKWEESPPVGRVDIQKATEETREKLAQLTMAAEALQKYLNSLEAFERYKQ